VRAGLSVLIRNEEMERKVEAALPKREHESLNGKPRWMLGGRTRCPTMLARVGVIRALNAGKPDRPKAQLAGIMEDMRASAEKLRQCQSCGADRQKCDGPAEARALRAPRRPF
jgi:hypothetical protein